MSEVDASMPLEETHSADKEALKQKAAAAKDAVADLAGEAKDYAKARAGDAKDAAGAWVDRSKAKVGQTAEHVAECIQRKPYQALAIAAGIGFVAGLILKRR